MFQAVGICKKCFYYLEKLGPSLQYHLIIYHSFFTILASKKSSLTITCIIFSTQTHYSLIYNLVYKA